MKWVNYVPVVVICQLYFISFAVCLGFKGQIIEIPSEVGKVQENEFKSPILNGANFQSRFKVDLIRLNNDSEPISYTSVLNKNYMFKFDDLTLGNYQLLIDSYDFILSRNRYQIQVDGNEIRAYEDDLKLETFNRTSETNVTVQPLVIEIKDIKQYYEQRLGSISDMLMNSPFGFIFRNKVYTIIFTVCLGIMATPYIIGWINPDFADHFQEVQGRAQNRKLEERRSEKIEDVSKQTTRQQGGTRQRKQN